MTIGEVYRCTSTNIVRVINRGEQKCIQSFGGENLMERDSLGDPGVNGRIILQRVFRRWDGGGMGWIGLA